MLVHPHLLGRQPHGAGDAELVLQFHLPLQHQRGWAEDQDRPIVEQHCQHSAGGECERFAQAHFVSQ
jgi:hypothetical protein